jgi:hypothetical protein
MVIMYKMTPEKRDKFTKKIDKMMDFLEEFKECLEEADEFGDVEYEEPSYRRHEGIGPSMRSRYSRRGGM